MPRIIVSANAVGAERQVDCPEGGALVDIADEHLLPIPFSCRSATCATCHVRVLEGAQCLAPAEDDELMTLEVVGGPPDSRLACQVQVRAGTGSVKLRPI